MMKPSGRVKIMDGFKGMYAATAEAENLLLAGYSKIKKSEISLIQRNSEVLAAAAQKSKFRITLPGIPEVPDDFRFEWVPYEFTVAKCGGVWKVLWFSLSAQ
jgi:hypothetical protein